MPLRRNSYGDLAPELQSVLMKNGMQAHLVGTGGAVQLVVQSHDSPMLSYNVTEQQIRKLADWGTNSANRGAYNTFADIVADDFFLPKNFVHARNANGRVSMGLHGYRVGVGEYGRNPVGLGRLPYHGGVLGWTPRQQDGFHMRRVGGAMFMQGGPIIPERPGGVMKPGELQSGGYGFYYKGNVRQGTQSVDPLQTIPEVQPAPQKPQEPAKPYKELIASDVYFSNEKWQECLQSHGIVIDSQAKTLTMSNQGLTYTLTDEQVKALTSNSVKTSSIANRIGIINTVIGNDFQHKLTFDMLNSKEQPSLRLKPEVEQSLNAQMQQSQMDFAGQQQMRPPDMYESKGVNGHALEETNKGWFREGAHGRSVDVGDIWVEKMPQQEGQESKYKMSAVINGEVISHEISQKQFDKFMAVDDYHRMKLFSKVFPEVDMKTVPGQGTNIGAAILAGLSVAGGAVAAFSRQGRMEPDVYMEHHSRGHVYMKPGVDTPQEIAARAFEAGVHASEHHGVTMTR